ncbi:hypothetical protein [Coprococcus eutactus]|nr:hypothetical protein [Coprococcus eutactus]MCQ5134368.1 hypothetical protein [Coprococcus eutactus]
MVDEDGYRSAVEVTVGDTVDDKTIFKSGLKAGEQVVVNLESRILRVVYM